jgi:hypothetical protein
MTGLYPIIRRKRRPLSVPDGPPTVNPEILKPDRLPPVAIVPLVASLPVSAPVSEPDLATKTRKKPNGTATEN